LLLVHQIIFSHRHKQFEATLIVDNFVDVESLIVYPEPVLDDHLFSLVQVRLLAAVLIDFKSKEQEHHVYLHHPLNLNMMDGLSLGALDLDLIGVEKLFNAFAIAHILYNYI
jgi:hypothetical protein